MKRYLSCPLAFAVLPKLWLSRLRRRRKNLIFYLVELKLISSAGLRVFSSTRKQLKERGGQVSFVHLQPQIQEVFDIIKALPGVRVFQDLPEMDRYLAARQRAHTERQ